MIHEAIGTEISASDLHAVLQLRSNVFIVEQDCVYDDIDGLDILETTRHLWIASAADQQHVVATLRILTDPDSESAPTAIGRVATSATHRRNGLAAQLMHRALEIIDGPAKLSAQAHLQGWYEGFGFTASGSEYLEDGIPHILMTRGRPGPTEDNR